MARTLRVGDSGDDVRELQIKVAGWAADSAQQTYVGIDGSFGAQTEAAVKRFQSSYGLTVDGVVGPQTHAQLDWLTAADGSTRHFNWSEFQSKDGSGFSGGKVSAAQTKENVRRLMWKLEALRRKAGNNPVTITSGFRSISHNASVGGASNSMHVYGIAADLAVANRTVTQVNNIARTCGFSGMYNMATAVHMDSRIEYPYGSQSWWWNY
ncbi:D-Ala-D-Ala carboxypeptidase family metallohydrolase [Alkaliphilus transvaalensis]|uniref:D-Ala-D-Ala carboxypeptidase family metallohydrolase n=1 Tax=Alkaliphilus transvaalensis TaxID=114628 RepID=UPI0006844EB2|nr:D-Ala-D-Ala carboxypeptidase family metallohydrolase [Alkaliphilus transvaalensis]